MTTLVEGKTKLIQKGAKPFTINMIAKDFLTGGDAAKKEELTDIGKQKTIQASNVFKMLEQNNIPTSFIELTSKVTPLLRIHASPATMTGIPRLVNSTPIFVP